MTTAQEKSLEEIEKRYKRVIKELHENDQIECEEILLKMKREEIQKVLNQKQG